MSRVKLVNMYLKVAFLVSLFFVCVSFSNLFSAELAYLPRDEKLETRTQDYAGAGLSRSALAIPSQAELINKIQRCDDCVNVVKHNCPDCCVTHNTDEQVFKKCTPYGDDLPNSDEYTCHLENATEVNQPVGSITIYGNSSTNCPAIFDVNTCVIARAPQPGLPDYPDNTSPLNHCVWNGLTTENPSGLNTTDVPTWLLPSPNNTGQSMACLTWKPRIVKAGTTLAECEVLSTGGWECEEVSSMPDVANVTAQQLCPPISNKVRDCSTGLVGGAPSFTQEENLAGAPSTDPYYLFPCEHSSLGTNCYRYQSTPELAACVQDCVDYTEAWDRYKKRTFCCDQQACSGNDNILNPENTCTYDPTISGWTNCCDSSSCDQRLNWTECLDNGWDDEMCCEKLSTTICSQLRDDLNACMTGSGQCSAASVEIDSNFKYDFVARSNDKLVITWQINYTPFYTPTVTVPSARFYTQVRIYETDDAGDPSGSPVYSSLANQGSLRGASTIYAATTTDNSFDFVAGNKYTVRLYYFIPQTAGYNTLGVNVKSLDFTIFKMRE